MDGWVDCRYLGRIVVAPRGMTKRATDPPCTQRHRLKTPFGLSIVALMPYFGPVLDRLLHRSIQCNVNYSSKNEAFDTMQIIPPSRFF